MPQGVYMVGYADDLVVMVKAKREEQIEELANMAMANVSRWMNNHGLQLAPEKTETILLIGRKHHRPLENPVLDGHQVRTKDTI